MLGTWHPANGSCNLLSLETTGGTTTHAATLCDFCYCAAEHNQVLARLQAAGRWSPTTKGRSVIAVRCTLTLYELFLLLPSSKGSALVCVRLDPVSARQDTLES